MREGIMGNLWTRFINKTADIGPIDKKLDERAQWLGDQSKLREYLRPRQVEGERLKVLSIGSSTGHEVDEIDSILEGVDITTFDPTYDLTKPVKKRLAVPNKFGENTVRVLSKDVRAENLKGIKDGEMDAVTIFFVMHHMDGKQHEQVIAEIRRVLKEGGLLFVAEDIVGDKEEEKITVKADRINNLEIFDDGEHNYRNEVEWKEFFLKQGFRLKEYNEVKPEKVRNGFFILEKVKDLEQEN
ncbi:MAG: methyltransferase domain-containing protein [Candidatus Magasanikbacteria bacterium]|nr:methyltransferase domain-containing protein [Candidatus Magasanikbacteria bacterium]